MKNKKVILHKALAMLLSGIMVCNTLNVPATTVYAEETLQTCESGEAFGREEQTASLSETLPEETAESETMPAQTESAAEPVTEPAVEPEVVPTEAVTETVREETEIQTEARTEEIGSDSETESAAEPETPVTETVTENIPTETEQAETETVSESSTEDTETAAIIEEIRRKAASLPTVEVLKQMSEEELQSVYDEVQAIADLYESLTVEQQEELSDEFARLAELMEWFNTRTEEATVMSTAQTPTYAGAYVYGNGTPLYIEAGTSGSTSIYYYNGSNKTYLLQNKDLSEWTIYGGFCKNSYTGDTAVTMDGGTVEAIFGSGYGSYHNTGEGSVRNATIKVTGGTVTQGIYAAGICVVTGNVTIIVTGGTVGSVFGCSSVINGTYGNAKVNGNVNMIITGGNVQDVNGGDSNNYPVGGSVSAIVAVPVKFLNSDSLAATDPTRRFGNLLYFNGSGWTLRGSVIIPSDIVLTIATGQTLTLSDNITNYGTIINNGTINVKNKYKNNGTITNNGTLNLYAPIVGYDFSGSGTFNFYAAYINEMNTVNSISVEIDGNAYNISADEYCSHRGKLYIWLPSGDTIATVNDKKYYGVTVSETQTELKTDYITVTDISGIPKEIKANSSITLSAILTPSENTTFAHTVEYELVDAGTTAPGTTLNGNILYAAGEGRVRIKVKASDSYTKMEQSFDIDVKYIPVTGFRADVPTVVFANARTVLPVATPSDASYQTIEWSIVNGQDETGASITNGVFTAKTEGNVTIRATIENGMAYGTPYTKDFTIAIVTIDEKSALDISLASITISQNNDGTLKVEYSVFGGDGYKNYKVTDPIIITGATGSNRIIVKSGTPSVVLSDCSITSNTSPFEICSGATVNLTLNEDNILKSTSKGAGLHVPSNAAVVIDGNGTLSATGKSAAGIGGGWEEDGGRITINGGTITATGGYRAAGIGGGSRKTGGTITINGGTVTATGGDGAAGIGGGYYGAGGTVAITGGTVIATGAKYGGAGIGGGYTAAGGTVAITGGSVKAINQYDGADPIGKGGNSGASHGILTNGDKSVSLRTLTLDGLTAAASVTAINGYDYGLKDVYTLDTNKLYFYLPSDADITTITAGGEDYICHSENTYYKSHDWSNLDGICTRCGAVCDHKGATGSPCSTCGKTLHTHSWTYTVSGGTVTATCANTDGNCANTDGGSVTLNVSDSYYGNAAAATVSGSFTNGAAYTITYDNGASTAPDTVASHTAKLTVSENDTEKASVTKAYNISYLPAPTAAYSISNGYKDKNNTYWFGDKAAVEVSAPDGYTIATILGGTYGTFVSLAENDAKAIYLKNEKGEMTDKINMTETIAFDKTAPTGKIEIISKGTWQKLLNKIGFGLFFKGDIAAVVSNDDKESGVKSVEYYLAERDLIEDSELSAEDAIQAIETEVNGEWSAYGNAISLKKNAKNVIYVKITDQVGNTAYINSEGIVLYTDAQADTEIVTAVYQAGAEKEAAVKLNGNTIRSVSNGDKALLRDTDYTVNNNVITLKADYLDTLNADEYTFTVSYDPLGLEYASSDNNDAPAATTFKLKVEKADGSVTNISDVSKTYDGDTAGNPTYTSLSTGGAIYEYKVSGAEDNTYTRTAPAEVGTYTVRVTVAADGNYKEASAVADFTISNADLTDVSVKQSGGLSYTGKPQTAAVTAYATAKGGQKVIFTYSDTQDGVYKESVPAFTPKGTYQVYYKASADNHNTASGQFEITISAAENAWVDCPTISGWTYGENANIPTAEAKFGDVRVTYTGTENDGTPYNSADAPTKAGTYKAVFTVAATNDYTGLTSEAPFTIARAKITVKADSNSKTYGDSDPTNLTWQITEGALAGDDTLIGISASRDSGENAATYAIKVTETVNSNPNYDITFVEGTFTINKSKLTVTAEDKSATYGDAAPDYTVIYSGFKNGDTKDSLDGTLSFDCRYGQGSDKGDYTITPKGYESDNYAFDYKDGTLTVSAKPITVAAVDAGKVYGEADPKFTWKVTSGALVGSDTLDIKLERTSHAETVDTYTIKAFQAEGANSNYVITFADGTFTISKKPITISWGDTAFVYDGTAKLPTASAVGAEFGDVLGLTVEGAQTEAGTGYTATVTGITGDKKDNYQLTTDVTKNFDIAKADQAAPSGLKGTAETIDEKADGYIKNITTAMEYRKNAETTYTAVAGTELTGLADGTYYIRYKEDSNHNASPDTVIMLRNDRKLKVTVPKTQVGYTLTADKNELVWHENVTLTFTLKEGYSELDNFAIKVNGDLKILDDEGKYTVTSAEKDITITVEGVADITAPDTEITLGTNKWNRFFHSITFGLFFQDTQKVTITADDKGSGVDKIYYYLAATELTEEQVKALTDDKWTEYTGEFGIDPENEYILYAKAVDHDNNTKYISSDKGIVIDSIAPTIAGIADGETHYGDTTFSVADKHLKEVKIDGKSVTLGDGQYTIKADGLEHTVAAADESGNTSAEIRITVITIASLDDTIESITTDNVKSSDKKTIEDVQSLVNGLINSGKDFTDAEDTELANIKTNTETLLKKISDVSDEMSNLTGKVNAYDKDKVKFDDKQDIIDLIADIDKLLEGDNLNDSEKENLGKIKDTAASLVERIEKVEAVEKLISKIPETVKKTDSDIIKKADDAYKALTEYEQTMLDKNALKKLNQAKKDLEQLNKETETKEAETEKAETNASQTQNPSTGDETNWMWLIVFFASGLMLASSAYNKKKKGLEL